MRLFLYAYLIYYRMKTILIPTDFTSIAHNAMHYAAELYKGQKIKYILFNCFELSHDETKSYLQIKQEHQESLEEDLKVLKDVTNNQGEYHSILNHGKLNFIPTELILENDVDLILMGTKGLSVAEQYIGRSHAGEFVTHVNANIIIVPDSNRYSPIKNVLFTTNYRNVKSLKTLNTLKELVGKEDANLFVLYVNKAGLPLTSFQKENKDRLEEFFKDNKVSFHEFLAASVEDEIEDFMLKYNIDLVSAIPMHNTFVERLFHKSLVKKLAEHATKPLFVLNHN